MSKVMWRHAVSPSLEKIDCAPKCLYGMNKCSRDGKKCPSCDIQKRWKNKDMTKLIALLLILAMAIQLIKPLGVPGLRRRMDFWKIALIAFAIWAVALIGRDLFV